MIISYTLGTYDILRAKDLLDLDKKIQLSKQKGDTKFAIGIYEDELCENLGFNKPLKNVNDRIKIVEQLRGVDIVFSIPSLDEEIIEKRLIEKYNKTRKKTKNNDNNKKEFKLAYAPGTYDLFHLGHLENLLEAANRSQKLIVGIKADELVQEHKNKLPIISAEERMEILRHFKFVYDTYIYYTRDLNIANDWIKSKYNHEVDAVFLGSDLKKDFSDTQGLNLIFTERDPKLMKYRSSTAYAKTYKTLSLDKSHTKKRYTSSLKNIGNNIEREH